MVSAMAVAPVSATFPTHPPPLHAGGVQQSAKMETEGKKKGRMPIRLGSITSITSRCAQVPLRSPWKQSQLFHPLGGTKTLSCVATVLDRHPSKSVVAIRIISVN